MLDVHIWHVQFVIINGAGIVVQNTKAICTIYSVAQEDKCLVVKSNVDNYSLLYLQSHFYE